MKKIIGALLLAALATAPGASAQTAGGDYAVGEKVRPEKANPPPPGVRDLQWEELVPQDWNPRKLLDDAGFDELGDADPRAMALLDELRAEWDKAPVVAALAGSSVRLPGFVVTLEADEQSVSEFLLVPYFGACIHVPPPPSNQVVHVVPAEPVSEELAIYPVWVVGKLQTVQGDSALGASGYRIDDARVEAYPWR